MIVLTLVANGILLLPDGWGVLFNQGF